MSTQQEDIRRLYEVCRDQNDRYGREAGERDAQVAQAIARISSNTPILDRIVMRHNNDIVIAKDAALANIDDKGLSESPWIAFNPHETAGELSYFNEGSLALIDLKNAHSYTPGFYESPQYSIDKCLSKVQFCIANSMANSDEINAKIAEIGINLISYGSWWVGASPAIAPVISIANKHPYSGVFFRFANYAFSGTVKQPIKAFGGNSSFSLNQTTAFITLKYKEVVL